jgi:hypothetical protein
MLSVIESGEHTWAVGATEGRLTIYQRDDEGWIELETQEGDELDEQAAAVLDAVYEGQQANGASASRETSTSSKDESEDEDDEDEEEPEDDEEDEEPRTARSRGGSAKKSSSRSRSKARR